MRYFCKKRIFSNENLDISLFKNASGVKTTHISPVMRGLHVINELLARQPIAKSLLKSTTVFSNVLMHIQKTFDNNNAVKLFVYFCMEIMEKALRKSAFSDDVNAAEVSVG